MKRNRSSGIKFGHKQLKGDIFDLLFDWLTDTLHLHYHLSIAIDFYPYNSG